MIRGIPRYTIHMPGAVKCHESAAWRRRRCGPPGVESRMCRVYVRPPYIWRFCIAYIPYMRYIRVIRVEPTLHMTVDGPKLNSRPLPCLPVLSRPHLPSVPCHFLPVNIKDNKTFSVIHSCFPSSASPHCPLKGVLTKRHHKDQPKLRSNPPCPVIPLSPPPLPRRNS
eukprot:333973-Chlamydomonas_euryale.AAC.1